MGNQIEASRPGGQEKEHQDEVGRAGGFCAGLVLVNCERREPAREAVDPPRYYWWRNLETGADQAAAAPRAFVPPFYPPPQFYYPPTFPFFPQPQYPGYY